MSVSVSVAEAVSTVCVFFHRPPRPSILRSFRNKKKADAQARMKWMNEISLSVFKKTVMMYTRASASDYDTWKTVHENPGWGSNELIPFLKKVRLPVPSGPVYCRALFSFLFFFCRL